MDQGIICLLKAKYLRNVVRKIIQSVEKKKTLPKIPLLQGMQMLVSSWDALSTQTTVNCLRKSGISTESQKTAIAEDYDPFRKLQDRIDDPRSVHKPRAVHTKLTTLLQRTLIPLPLPMLMLKL